MGEIGCPVKFAVGARFRDKLSNQLFRVRKIEENKVVLETEDRPKEFLLGHAVLDILFDRVEDQEESA